MNFVSLGPFSFSPFPFSTPIPLSIISSYQTPRVSQQIIAMVRIPSSKNNDTKRKEVFHTYNTRSSRKHQKNYIQLKDNTSSVPGSSNTVKGKPAAGRPAKKIPFSLYNCAKAALAARKVWEAKRDKDSELELQLAEDLVNSSAYYYKYIDPVLPRNWKYNPATVSTLEPKDNIPLLRLVEEPEKKMKTKDGDDDSDSDSESDSDYNSDPDPSITFPKLNGVPLKEDDIESWLQFKKLDEAYPTSVPGLELFEIEFPVNIEHPFVSVIGYFAVNGFNESFETFVKKGEHNHLRDPAFTECTYNKLGSSYRFKMTIVANEYGFRGIYRAKVRCNIDNGNRSLLEFSLTDIKCGKKGRASKSKSSKGVGVDVRLPEYTGMWLRRNITALTCRGYDYHGPTKLRF